MCVRACVCVYAIYVVFMWAGFVVGHCAVRVARYCMRLLLLLL